MKKTWYKIINKIPKLFKPVPVAVILVMTVSAIAAAVVMSNRNDDSATRELTTSSQSDQTVVVSSEPDHALSLYTDDQLQHTGNAEATSKVPQTSQHTSSNSASNYSIPDADGCTPSLDNYKKCRAAAARLEFMDDCSADMSAAEDAYAAIMHPAFDSYEADVAAKQQEVNNDIAQYGYSQGWGDGVMYRYMQQRVQQYHDTVDPAYSTYESAVNAINARGCNLLKLYTAPDL